MRSPSPLPDRSPQPRDRQAQPGRAEQRHAGMSGLRWRGTRARRVIPRSFVFFFDFFRFLSFRFVSPASNGRRVAPQSHHAAVLAGEAPSEAAETPMHCDSPVTGAAPNTVRAPQCGSAGCAATLRRRPPAPEPRKSLSAAETRGVGSPKEGRRVPGELFRCDLNPAAPQGSDLRRGDTPGSRARTAGRARVLPVPQRDRFPFPQRDESFPPRRFKPVSINRGGSVSFAAPAARRLPPVLRPPDADGGRGNALAITRPDRAPALPRAAGARRSPALRPR
ncbi:uncharacterized protein PRD47_009507 isoform 1-T1 [Ara ararauna]